MIRNYKSGELLLRVLIREAHIDTNATLRKIYGQIQDLPNYMAQVNSDIIKFNMMWKD